MELSAQACAHLSPGFNQLFCNADNLTYARLLPGCISSERFQGFLGGVKHRVHLRPKGHIVDTLVHWSLGFAFRQRPSFGERDCSPSCKCKLAMATTPKLEPFASCRRKDDPNKVLPDLEVLLMHSQSACVTQAEYHGARAISLRFSCFPVHSTMAGGRLHQPPGPDKGLSPDSSSLYQALPLPTDGWPPHVMILCHWHFRPEDQVCWSQTW